MASQNYVINQEWDDDDSYAAYESYDDDDSYGYDDESLGSFIDKGLRTVSGIVTGGVSNALGTVKRVGQGIGTVLGINTSPASTAGIQPASNLNGSLQTNTGKVIPVQLPSSVATKQDVSILQGAVRKINEDLQKIATTTNNNGVALTKLSTEVKSIDEKHIAATKKQNDLLHELGKGVDKLGKDLKNTKQQAQMQMMMSMFMQPEIDKITFKNTGGAVSDNTEYTVTTDSGNDNSFLPFLLMGGMGGDNSFGDMNNNPMMMLVMMKAFEK